MNVRALRRPGEEGTAIHIGKSAKKVFLNLSKRAHAMFSSENPEKWKHPPGSKQPESSFFQDARRGVLVLERIGLASSEVMRMDDMQVFYAFIACLGLAYRSETLPASIRRVLREVIKLFTSCIPLAIDVPALPPLESLPKRLRDDPDVLRQYECLRQTDGLAREIMLDDGVVVYRILKAVRRPEDEAVWVKLRYTTAAVSTVLRSI